MARTKQRPMPPTARGGTGATGTGATTQRRPIPQKTVRQGRTSSILSPLTTKRRRRHRPGKCFKKQNCLFVALFSFSLFFYLRICETCLRSE